MTASDHKIPQFNRFGLVGNLSRSSLQARIETFNGICLCQTRTSEVPTIGKSCEGTNATHLEHYDAKQQCEVKPYTPLLNPPPSP
ncbi:hypothetical protein MTR_3g068160 [Medicago truncatula]|uniref:Uncharacterized protein n=1 Tax=Medicago truncatula TaxID=3880 RepID=A0A072V989_MEDTR|nr:hypothetical protein MTR_3g068160 [Medicago truncatula]